jgi:hypothetical protein
MTVPQMYQAVAKILEKDPVFLRWGDEQMLASREGDNITLTYQKVSTFGDTDIKNIKEATINLGYGQGVWSFINGRAIPDGDETLAVELARQNVATYLAVFLEKAALGEEETS